MDIIPSEEKLSWRVTGGIIDMVREEGAERAWGGAS